MNKERLKCLLSDAIYWATECGGSIPRDLIRATCITREELSQLGFEESEYPDLYKYVDED